MGEIAVSYPAQKRGRRVVNGRHWMVTRWDALDHLVERQWIIVDNLRSLVIGSGPTGEERPHRGWV
jgi:hypothetical protein